MGVPQWFSGEWFSLVLLLFKNNLLRAIIKGLHLWENPVPVLHENEV